MSRAVFETSDGRRVKFGRAVASDKNGGYFDCGHNIETCATDADNLILCRLCDRQMIALRLALRGIKGEWETARAPSRTPPPPLIALKFWEMRNDANH